MIRGFGAAEGSRTGTPGGRLSTKKLSVASPSTQSSQTPRAIQRESARGVIVKLARPSAPVRTVRLSTHFLPSRR